MTNERAQAWITSRGYKPEPEPDWITMGRRPDFYCAGRSPIWVEVKTLDPAGFLEALGSAWDDLRERCAKLEGTGSIDVLIGNYDGKAARVGLACAAAALREPAVPNQVRTVIVPADARYDLAVTIEYDASSGDRVVQSGPASACGSFRCYPSLEPANWLAEGTLRLSDGTEIAAPLHKFLESSVPYVLAMRVLPSEKPISICSVSSGQAHRNMTQWRVRDVVRDANDQLRNGQRFRAAPGVVAIFHDSADSVGEETLLAALFGDLTVPVDPDPIRLGEAFLGLNGVLAPTKNRGISAVRYAPHKGDPITVINPYAEHPIDWRSITDAAWVLDGNRFVRVAEA